MQGHLRPIPAPQNHPCSRLKDCGRWLNSSSSNDTSTRFQREMRYDTDSRVLCPARRFAHGLATVFPDKQVTPIQVRPALSLDLRTRVIGLLAQLALHMATHQGSCARNEEADAETGRVSK